MPEDIQSIVAARAQYAHEANKKLNENIQEVFRAYAKTPEGKMKFKKNAKGQYIDKDGKVIDVSNILKELESKKYVPVSLADFIKEANLRQTLQGGRYSFPEERYDASGRSSYSPAELQQMIDWETSGTKPVFSRTDPFSYIQGNFLPKSLLKPVNAEYYNQTLLDKGLVPNEEFTPYQRYPGERVEPLNAEQKALIAEGEQLPQMLANSKGMPALQEMIVPGHQTREILESSKKFMDPTTDLFNAWEQEAARKYKERVEKELNPRFIKSGTWASGPHWDLKSKYLEENQKNLELMKLQHLHKAQEHARERGTKAYEMRQKDVGELANEESNSFKKNIAAIALRNDLQKQRQQLGQQERDFDLAEFVRERDDPLHKAEAMSNLNNQVQHNSPLNSTQVSFAGNPAAAQPGNSSITGAGAIMLAGMLGKGAHAGNKEGGHIGFKEGGAVYKKNYAPGGNITSSKIPMINQSYLGPSQRSLTPDDLVRSRVQQEHGGGIGDLFKGMSFQMDRPKPTDADLNLNTPEINSYRQRAAQLEKAPFTPFWDSVGAFGAGMLGSGGKNTNEMLAGGGTKAWDAFNQAYDKREDNRDKVVNLNKAIQETRQTQMEREMSYREKRDDSLLNRVKATAEDRRANDRLGFDRMKHKDDQELEYTKLKAKGAIEPIILGDRIITPRAGVKMTPADITHDQQIEKDIKKEEEEIAPFKNLEKLTEGKKDTQGILGSTGRLIYDWTPNFKEDPREYARTLKDVVRSQLPPGPHTKAKQDFAESSKPTERDTYEGANKFAKKGIKAREESLQGKRLARVYAAYNIPPRITLGAYEVWIQNNKEGNFEDYLADVLEGKRPVKPKSSEESMVQNSTLPGDVSKMSTKELEQVAFG